jgi:hypothetical protein
MDALLDAAVTFAQEMLGERGAFFPFGAIVLDDGHVAMSPGDPGLGDHPDSQAVIDALAAAFREQASGGGIRACAICCDVRTEADAEGMTDAIRTTIEHRESDPVHVLLPYRLEEELPPTYGELRAVPAEPSVFAG